MKQQDIRMLKLMESLERDPKKTQRDLAEELNISLGLVNSFIKRLIQKGFFKIKTIPRNRIKYILTPKGMYEKTRLTYEYIVFSLGFYKETRSKFKKMFDQLRSQGKERVFLIGAGELAEIAIITLQDSDLSLASLIDTAMAGKKFMGIPVKDFSSLEGASSFDMVIITKQNCDKNIQKLIPKHIPSKNIIELNK